MMAKKKETTIICTCGNDLFYVDEQAKDKIFSPDTAISYLYTALMCTSCGKKRPDFVTSLVGPGERNSSDEKIKKVCPLCKSNTFHADYLITFRDGKGFFDVEFAEFKHTLRCSNKKCPWKLRSIAQAIHKEEKACKKSGVKIR